MAVNRESSGTESPTPSGERATAIELIATRITAASGAVASMLPASKLSPHGRLGGPRYCVIGALRAQDKRSRITL